MQTFTGKSVSVTTGFRLPFQDYQAAVELAKRENVRVSVTMRRLVAAGLAVLLRENDENKKVTQ